MPLATCVLSPHLKRFESNENIIELWGKYSGQPSNEMTLTFTQGGPQFGRAYAIIANLSLPSLWSDAAIRKLQLGLSQTLAEYFNVGDDQIIICTTVLKSGLVIEAGKVLEW